MDRRQQKTREAIFEAFGALLSRKRYARITVQDIIDEANVGRTTFYAHFNAKEDLLREMCTDLFAHVFSDQPHSERTHDFSSTGAGPAALITHILYHLLDNRRNLIGLLTSESDELFLSYFKGYLNELLAAQLLGGAAPQALGVPYDFLVSHISSSFVGMVQWWIAGGLKETPEALAGYFMAVIGPGLRGDG